MKKLLIVLFILIAAGGGAWFMLLRPETVSQTAMTQDFETHRQAYEDTAAYLIKKGISADITDVSKDGSYDGIEAEDSAEYRVFMAGVEEIMSGEHDAIRSDGSTVEFVYHSTGGRLRRLYGSVIYNGGKKVEGKVTVPLTTDGWHLYLAQE